MYRNLIIIVSSVLVLFMVLVNLSGFMASKNLEKKTNKEVELILNEQGYALVQLLPENKIYHLNQKGKNYYGLLLYPSNQLDGLMAIYTPEGEFYQVLFLKPSPFNSASHIKENYLKTENSLTPLTVLSRLNATYQQIQKGSYLIKEGL